MLRPHLLEEVDRGYEEVRMIGMGVEGVKGEVVTYWHSSIVNPVDSNLALEGGLNGGYEDVRRIGRAYWYSSIVNPVDSNLALEGGYSGGYEGLKRVGKWV